MRLALVVGVLLGALGMGCGGPGGAQIAPKVARTGGLGIGGGPADVGRAPEATPPSEMLAAHPAHEVLVRYLACGFGDGWEAALDHPPRTWKPHDIDQCHDLAFSFSLPASEMHTMTPLATDLVKKTVTDLAAEQRIAPAARDAMAELIVRSRAAIVEMQGAEDTMSSVREGRSAGRIEPEQKPSTAEAAALGANRELEKLERFSLTTTDARSAADAAALGAMIGLWRFGQGARLPPGYRWAATYSVVVSQILDGASSSARSFHDLLVDAARRGFSRAHASLPTDLGKVDVLEEEEHEAERTIFADFCQNLRRRASDLWPSELRSAALGMAEAFERERVREAPDERPPASIARR